MNFFPVCHKLCENHSTIINFWITFIFLKHYLPILCPDIRKTMLLSRFLEVFHPFRIKGLCNGDTAFFQKFLLQKTWCLSLYRINFTIIARDFWPGRFRFPNLWLLSILIWEILMCLVCSWWHLKSFRQCFQFLFPSIHESLRRI